MDNIAWNFLFKEPEHQNSEKIGEWFLHFRPSKIMKFYRGAATLFTTLPTDIIIFKALKNDKAMRKFTNNKIFLSSVIKIELLNSTLYLKNLLPIS